MRKQISNESNRLVLNKSQAHSSSSLRQSGFVLSNCHKNQRQRLSSCMNALRMDLLPESGNVEAIARFGNERKAGDNHTNFELSHHYGMSRNISKDHDMLARGNVRKSRSIFLAVRMNELMPGSCQ